MSWMHLPSNIYRWEAQNLWDICQHSIAFLFFHLKRSLTPKGGRIDPKFCVSWGNILSHVWWHLAHRRISPSYPAIAFLADILEKVDDDSIDVRYLAPVQKLPQKFDSYFWRCYYDFRYGFYVYMCISFDLAKNKKKRYLHLVWTWWGRRERGNVVCFCIFRMIRRSVPKPLHPDERKTIFWGTINP